MQQVLATQTYQCGSIGPDVIKIQTQLASLRLYNGPLDGNFGGGTQSAVKVFQRSVGLTNDGIVGPATWAKLFKDNPTTEEPALKSQSLSQRCLALTGSFETNSLPPDCYAGLSGNFDGQGLSLGACQWNLGQKTLQPMFIDMAEAHSEVLDNVMQDYSAEFRRMLTASLEEQLAWASSIQDQRYAIVEPWRGLFKTLTRTPEFQAIEVSHAAHFHDDAVALCKTYDLTSQRAIALMFDIRVQNGSISEIIRTQIERDFVGVNSSLSPPDREVARLRIVANRRSDAASAAWREDVRARKLAVANGSGTVHGRYYDLESQYGITLNAP